MTHKLLEESIIYQDASFLVANKPAGIAAQNDLSEDKSFHELLEEHCSKKLFVVHRLDRPTSGIMVFAKKKKAAAHFSKLLSSPLLEKKYYAVVKNVPDPASGRLEHLLYHDQKHRKSYISSKDRKDSKKAILNYKSVAAIDNYNLLEVSLETGRFHQIRSQLAAVGSPIKGDVKYGARRSNKDRSIGLHSSNITFPLLYDDEYITVHARAPKDNVWAAFGEQVPEMENNKFEKWKKEK